MSRRRSDMTTEQIERARAQERLRQKRRRARAYSGQELVLLPTEIADEFVGDDGKLGERAIKILRRNLGRDFA